MNKKIVSAGIASAAKIAVVTAATILTVKAINAYLEKASSIDTAN